RKLLGGDNVVSLRERRLTLDARAVWVDSRALEHVLGRIEAALGSGEAAGALDALERRLYALYSGEFLPGETRAWAVAPPERLREGVLRALEQLGARYEARGEGMSALRCYRAGIEAAPAAETAYYRLICCHRALGQPLEALAAYRQCRHALATIGVRPSRHL